jgi:translation initiation factor 2 subunit 1
MVRKRSEWPSVDELVLCTVKEVFDQGAFVTLDEYGGKEGMVHISEVASGWIKNIRDHVREGQKVVCRVLTVHPERNVVDLSIRRVKDSERRWKVERFKLEQRAEKLLELAAKRMKKSLDRAYEEVGYALQERFGDLYAAFEAAAQDPKALEEALKRKKRWAKVLTELASTLIKTPTYRITGELKLTISAPNGVEILKSAMLKARNDYSKEGVKVDFYTVGSPRYRIEVSAPSYKEAEIIMRQAAERVIAEIEEAGGEGEFRREIE